MSYYRFTRNSETLITADLKEARCSRTTPVCPRPHSPGTWCFLIQAPEGKHCPLGCPKSLLEREVATMSLKHLIPARPAPQSPGRTTSERHFLELVRAVVGSLPHGGRDSTGGAKHRRCQHQPLAPATALTHGLASRHRNS